MEQGNDIFHRDLSSNTTSSGLSDSAIVRQTFRVYGAIYAASFLLFSVFLFPRFPRYYNLRSWVEEMECSLAKRTYCWWSWFYTIFQVSDQEIFDHCGMDALCFVRVMRWGRQLSLLGCFNAIWLIPMYKFAKDSPETASVTDPLAQCSVANLRPQSLRFIGTILAAYIIFGYAMYLIFQEFQWYTFWRHKFLSKRDPRNYTVYVSGIPKSYRSSHELYSYFNSCSRGGVIEAHVTMDVPKLETLTAKREQLVRKIEHARALQKQPKRYLWSRRKLNNNNDTIDAYQEELEDLNQRISESIQGSLSLDDPMRSQLTRVSAEKHLQVSNEEEERNTEPIQDVEQGNVINVETLETVHEDLSHHETSEDWDDSLFDPDIPHLEFQGTDGPQIVENGAHPPMPHIESSSLPASPTSPKSKDEDEEDELDRIAAWQFRKLSDDFDHVAIQYQEKKDTPKLRNRKEADVDTVAARQFRNLSEDYDHNDKAPPSRRSFFSRSQEATGSSSSSDASLGRMSLRLPELVAETSRSARKSISSGTKAARHSIVEGSRELGHSIIAGSRIAGEAVKKVTKDVKVEKIIKTATEGGTHIISTATGAVAPHLVVKVDGEHRNAGFVSFSSLYTTQTALQTIHHPKPYSMIVQEAPDPHDIFWPAVGLSSKSRRTGRTLSLGSSAVLCFFWSVPTAFIASLTQIDSIKNEVPRLSSLIQNYPFMEKLLAQLAPLLLLLSNEVILPAILKWFASWEGHVSASMLEASLFVKLGFFMIIQTFFVSAISGSITSEISSILDNPSSIVNLLATSLPSQSTYFMQIVLAQTLLLKALDLLRIYQLGLAFIRRCIGPNLTKKERRRSWMGLASLEEPPEFWHAESLAQVGVLFFTVFFVYATIAPIICFVLLLCFLLLEGGHRFQFIHNFPRENDTGGKLWLSFIQFMLACIIIAQITLIGLLLLKQSRFAAPGMLPLICITVFFILYINGRHTLVLRHLPSRDCVLLDREHEEAGFDTDFLRDRYLQPALKKCWLDPDDSDEEERVE